MHVIHKSSGKSQNRFGSLLAVMICTFVTFIAFLFAIFSRLYTGAKENVVQIQRNEVLNSVSDFDFYFNAAINAVTFSGNNMLVLHEQNAAPEEFDRAIKIMSDTFLSYIQDSIAGSYGYVYGRYLDGHDWIPGPDYDPQSRSWYLEAVAKPGELVCVPPYVDAESGRICLTLAQTLADDPESVVAFDIALDTLQKSIDETVKNDAITSAKIIDRSMKVIVVSSDHDEELTSYQEPGHFLENVDDLAQGSNLLRYGGKTYLVFIEPLAIGWDYVCVYDYSKLLGSMRYIYLASGGAIIIFVALVFVVFYNVLVRQKSIERLKQRSETDALTGIRNRGSGEELIRSYLSEGAAGALLMFDVDKFKSINDTYGHEVGDKVIISVAKSLADAARKNDVVMRLGGDEFVCFLYSVSRQEDVMRFSERLFEKIAGITVKEAPELTITVSAGAALCNGREKIDFSELYRRADEKVYVSKRVRGNYISI